MMIRAHVPYLSTPFLHSFSRAQLTSHRFLFEPRKIIKKSNDLNVYGEESLYTVEATATATFLTTKNKIIYINARLTIENERRTNTLSWTKAHAIWFPSKDRIVEAPLNYLFQPLGTFATGRYSYGASTTTDVIIGVPAPRHYQSKNRAAASLLENFPFRATTPKQYRPRGYTTRERPLYTTNTSY